MIIGLEKFKERFAGLEDQYVLIGGVAAYLALDEAGLQPRATKDLDIVLSLEVLNARFGTAFWKFVQEGGYEHLQHSTGEKIFYRFSKPQDANFPVMLELFSRTPEGMVQPPADTHLVPIPVDEDVASLSAILLDSDYYSFLHEYREVLNGLSILREQGLIPLKAKAWLDLTERKEAGEAVDSRDIKKHRSDILRLYQLLNPTLHVDAPESIKNDLRNFLNALAAEEGLNLSHFGLGDTPLTKVVATLKSIYQLEE